jgi:hypothetical protein
MHFRSRVIDLILPAVGHRTWRPGDERSDGDGCRVGCTPARPETRLPNRLTRGRKPRREEQRAEFALRGLRIAKFQLRDQSINFSVSR